MALLQPQASLDTNPILHSMSDGWAILRGVLAIIFGVLTFVWPAITLVALVLLFGVYAILDGIVAGTAAIVGEGRSAGARWGLAAICVLSILAGFAAFLWPGLTALALIYLIGAWALVTGLVEIYEAFALRREITNDWALIASGVISVLFGILVMAMPGAGAVALVWVIGAYAIIAGLLRLMIAVRIRRRIV